MSTDDFKARYAKGRAARDAEAAEDRAIARARLILDTNAGGEDPRAAPLPLGVATSPPAHNDGLGAVRGIRNALILAIPVWIALLWWAVAS